MVVGMRNITCITRSSTHIAWRTGTKKPKKDCVSSSLMPLLWFQVHHHTICHNSMMLYNRPCFFTQPGAHDPHHQPVAVVAVDNLQGKEDSTEACCNSKIHQQCDYVQVGILVLWLIVNGGFDLTYGTLSHDGVVLQQLRAHQCQQDIEHAGMQQVSDG